MKVHLVFTLPEDKADHKSALEGPSMAIALQEIYDQIIRKRLKYGELSDSDAKLLEEIKTEFFEILDQHDLELY